MLFAGGAKRSLGDANRGADFRQIKRPVGIGLQEFLKPRDNGVVTTAASPRLSSGAFGKAPHHDMSELILQRATYFRDIQNIRHVMSELPYDLVQSQQSEHRRRMRADNSFLRHFDKLATEYRLNSSIKVISRKRDRAIVEVRAGSLMYDVGSVHDDIAGQDLQATVQEG